MLFFSLFFPLSGKANYCSHTARLFLLGCLHEISQHTRIQESFSVFCIAPQMNKVPFVKAAIIYFHIHITYTYIYVCVYVYIYIYTYSDLRNHMKETLKKKKKKNWHPIRGIHCYSNLAITLEVMKSP